MERTDLPEKALPDPTLADAAGPGAKAPSVDAAAAVTLFVCTTCRPVGAEGGQDAAALLTAARKRAAAAGIVVAGVRCLANCKRGLSAALARRDGWTYVFGDLSAGSAADLVAGARLLAAAPDGLMPWRGRPDSLKRGMVARIPPFAFSEEP